MKISTTILLLFLLCPPLFLIAQTHYMPGYIITQKLDTVACKIVNDELKSLQKLARVKSKELGRVTLTPTDVYAYGFINGMHFEAQNVDGELVFLQKLVDGKVSLYSFNNKDPRYFIVKDHPPAIELKYTKELITYPKDQRNKNTKLFVAQVMEDNKNRDVLVYGEYKVSEEKFQQQLMKEFGEDTVLHQEIKSISGPERSSLIALVESCNKGSAKVYHNTNPTMLKKQTELEFSMAYTNLLHGYLNADDHFWASSFKAHIPFADRYMYLTLGVQYANPTKYLSKSFYESYRIFKFPAGLRFQYPGFWVKPHAEVGSKLYHIATDGTEPQKSGFIFDVIPYIHVGISVNVYKSVALTLSAEREFCWNSYNNSNNATFSTSFYGGVAIGF